MTFRHKCRIWHCDRCQRWHAQCMHGTCGWVDYHAAWHRDAVAAVVVHQQLDELEYQAKAYAAKHAAEEQADVRTLVLAQYGKRRMSDRRVSGRRP